MTKENNRYFSISEAADATGLAVSKLRYIEKFNPLIKTIKIRDRRYYTIQVINYIKSLYKSSKKTTAPLPKINENLAIISRIDIILDKLRKFI